MSRFNEILEEMGEVDGGEEALELSALSANIFNWFNPVDDNKLFINSLIFNAFMYRSLSDLFVDMEEGVHVMYEPAEQVLVYSDTKKDIIFTIDILNDDATISYSSELTKEKGEEIMEEAKKFLELFLNKIRAKVMLCVGKMKECISEELDLDDKKIEELDEEIDKKIEEQNDTDEPIDEPYEKKEEHDEMKKSTDAPDSHPLEQESGFKEMSRADIEDELRESK